MTGINLEAIRVGTFSHSVRVCSTAIFLAGCIFVVAAVWSYADRQRTPSYGQWLTIDPSIVDIGTIPQGLSQAVRFEVINRNHHKPVIIFGATETCGPQGCIDGSNIPVTVPPGSRAMLQFVFRAGFDPVFDYSMTIYSDAPGQTESKVKIVGKTSSNTNPEYY